MSDQDRDTEIENTTEGAHSQQGVASEPADNQGSEGGPQETRPEEVPSSPDRRKLLVGAGIGAVAAAGAVYGATRLLRPRWATEVRAVYVPQDLPVTDPESSAWSRAPEARVQMGPQLQALPTKPKPEIAGLSVKAMHDGRKIAFRLQWKAKGPSTSTVRTEWFRDACAVLLAPTPDDQNLRVMGSPAAPVTMLHWKADWQNDVDSGFQDLDSGFPNASFDFYPPLVRRDKNGPIKVPDEYVRVGAQRYLAGYAVGNPLSLIDRRTPVEKLRATSPGTLATFDNQDAEGRGVLDNGSWKVVLAKPLRATDPDEVSLLPEGSYGVAFAVWMGSARDVGARKTVSQMLLRLYLEPPATTR